MSKRFIVNFELQILSFVVKSSSFFNLSHLKLGAVMPSFLKFNN